VILRVNLPKHSRMEHHDDRRPSIDPARFLKEELAEASPDLLRELLTTFVNALLSA